MPPTADDRVLVDYRTSDDAGVYRWDEDTALVQTVDFFTPVVDDPATFGAIAAANALSDVYAMGGRPLTALAVAGFPKADVDGGLVRAVFLGGLGKLREAGVALLGGHTVQDPEIKFGYAVTGVVSPREVWSNAGARPGDVLLLTKPIGTGVVATAIKFDRAPAASMAHAIEVMQRLNGSAAAALRGALGAAVHACTDITGFGLIGHATEMAAASAVSLRLDAAAVPLIEGVLALALANTSGGGRSNEAHFSAGVGLDPERPIGPERLALFYDPQTSGGLLASVAPQAAGTALDALREAGVAAARIGVVEGRGRFAIVLG